MYTVYTCMYTYNVFFNCMFPMQEVWTTVLLRVMFCLSFHSMCMEYDSYFLALD